MRWSVGWVLTISCAVAVWAQEKENPQLTVVVYDRVAASLSLLGSAEGEAGRILGQAGIEVQWVNCLAEEKRKIEVSCYDPAKSDSISMRVVRKPVSLSEHALGVAFLEGGGGRYADIFFDHVERLRGKETGVNLDTIFGYAMAHEIGHLLLGSNSHSRSGIMQGEWRGDQLRSIALGELLFTSEQAQRMRERVIVQAMESRPQPILAGVRE